jgi:hypothetical protein
MNSWRPWRERRADRDGHGPHHRPGGRARGPWLALIGSTASIVTLASALIVLLVTREDNPLPLQRGEVTVTVAESHLRMCPTTACQPVTVLGDGTELIVLGAREGELVEGSVVWMEALSAEGRGFIHISLVDVPSVQGSGEILIVVGVIALALIAVVLNVIMFVKGTLIRRVMNYSWSNPALFIVVLMSGLICVSLALLGSEGVEINQFASDALLNLGAGFIGAAVTYVLFQVLVSHRSSATDLEIAMMRESIGELRQLIKGSSGSPINRDLDENDCGRNSGSEGKRDTQDGASDGVRPEEQADENDIESGGEEPVEGSAPTSDEASGDGEASGRPARLSN